MCIEITETHLLFFSIRKVRSHSAESWLQVEYSQLMDAAI